MYLPVVWVGKDRPRRMKIEQGFQIPFASELKSSTGIATMGVGFLWDTRYCEQLIETGQVDMIAVARELLANPNWPLLSASELGINDNHELAPIESGWWLMKRDRLLKKLGLR